MSGGKAKLVRRSISSVPPTVAFFFVLPLSISSPFFRSRGGGGKKTSGRPSCCRKGSLCIGARTFYGVHSICILHFPCTTPPT
ncbi:uncharacterized protein LY79DRAFT_539633 [Colletotrichum navitas]|uniref:Uncharacterized protein n=1 Tax=Colletotrichum navitas TaxID=681940 RepID=A0AAD8Q9L7_9PEZI|nr:uncharacterized protein LY79DRAFT_539633 [Colletotrichum navitas]KAK1597956.1 hypothetical protein LY79DRAFT_539633 [Colletotrichum navitas]